MSIRSPEYDAYHKLLLGGGQYPSHNAGPCVKLLFMKAVFQASMVYLPEQVTDRFGSKSETTCTCVGKTAYP